MNTKRLFVLILSLALLVGSAFAVSVSAAEDGSLEIVAMNIAHGDQTYVVMAVGASVADAEAGNVEVNYTYGGETYAATYWADFGGYTEDGVTYPVYYTKGISPKDLGEDVLVEAHMKGADIASPDYTDVSVAKYLFRMLYREGFVESVDEHEQHLAGLYSAHLLYGANAQQALWNDKAENADNQRVLLSDVNYVYVKNGGTIDGSAEAILNEDGTVTLTPDGTVAGVVGWNVTSYDLVGNKTETAVFGNEVAISANSVLTPFIDNYLVTFDNLAVGTQYDNSDKKILLIDSAAEGGGNVSLNTVGPAFIVEDYDGDNGVSCVPGAWFWFYSGNENTATYNTSVISTDINFTSIKFYSREKIQVRTGTGSTDQFNIEWGWIYNDGDGSNAEFGIRINDMIGGTNSGWIKMGVNGTATPKFNLKIEYIWATGQIRVSVDGNAIYNAVITSSTTPIVRSIYMNNATNTVVLDNVKALNTYVDPTGFATAE